MSTSILIIAHAPLAHALRECALHVFADCGAAVTALDVQPHEPPEETLAQARILLANMATDTTLVLTDVFGATPSNVAVRLVEGRNARVLTGVNLPMLLRAWCYRAESLESLVARAQAGGTQGIMLAGGGSAPQNQNPRVHHDPDPSHHQQ